MTNHMFILCSRRLIKYFKECLINIFLLVVIDMNDDIGRLRLEKPSQHNSICKERDATNPPPKEGCRTRVIRRADATTLLVVVSS